MLKFLSFLLFVIVFNSFASSLTPLPLSYGALLYDVNYPSGPGSHGTVEPGQWADDIISFNQGAKSQI